MSTDSSKLLPIGTSLSGGRYRVEGHIASGGFGNTYLATNTSLDKHVAIKEHFIKNECLREGDSQRVYVTHPDNAQKYDLLRKKFCKEAKRLFDISNPHVVRVLDLFDELDTSYYVMEHIDGESLSARLKHTQKPLTEAEVRSLLPQLLDGLEAIHAQHIWHLDLKPGNIMMDKNRRAVLIDFGASKQLTTAEGETLSTSSAMAFTPGYAPSEQHENKIDKFGPWTDLYALGATLYHLLTLLPPPTASDINDDPEDAFRLPNTVSADMRQLIMWMMQPQRLKRPQSVEEVRQKLVAAPTGKPTTPVGKPSTANTSNVPLASNNTPASTTSASHSSVATTDESTVVMGQGNQSTLAQQPQIRNEQHVHVNPLLTPTKKSKRFLIIVCVLLCLAGIGAGVYFLTGKKAAVETVESKAKDYVEKLTKAYEEGNTEEAEKIFKEAEEWEKGLSEEDKMKVEEFGKTEEGKKLQKALMEAIEKAMK